MTEEKSEKIVFIHYGTAGKAMPARQCILLHRNHDASVFEKGEQVYISNYFVKVIAFGDEEVQTKLIPMTSVDEIIIKQERQKNTEKD